MRAYPYIYVHIPFCEVICHYCHFYTARAKEARQPEFFSVLEKDLARSLPLLPEKLAAIYFGGGTPAASPPELVASFLEKLAEKITPETEITLEANPTNVTAENVKAWKNAGINRISLGIQSLDDALLKSLGRVHSAMEARRAAETCLKEIPNVSGDLLYAVPGQSEELPGKHALELARLGIQHISCYHLTLGPEHFLHPKLPPDAFAWKQIHAISEQLSELGFLHYEIASFAAPGRESRNNKNYWNGGPYLAFGPSAHGFDGNNERWSNVSDWREYIRRIEAGESPRAWTENLTPEQRRIEVIFTSLRTSEGLDLDDFQRRFGENLTETRAKLLARWAEEGLGRITKGRLVLNFSGRMLADEIARSLL
jgi:oxygen-independent coproporphyrinogen-3 oxidase